MPSGYGYGSSGAISTTGNPFPIGSNQYYWYESRSDNEKSTIRYYASRGGLNNYVRGLASNPEYQSFLQSAYKTNIQDPQNPYTLGTDEYKFYASLTSDQKASLKSNTYANSPGVLSALIKSRGGIDAALKDVNSIIGSQPGQQKTETYAASYDPNRAGDSSGLLPIVLAFVAPGIGSAIAADLTAAGVLTSAAAAESAALAAGATVAEAAAAAASATTIANTVGTVIASTALQTAAGVDPEKALQNAVTQVVVQAGSVAAAKEINTALTTVVNDPNAASTIAKVSNAAGSALASGATAAIKGGSTSDIIESAIAGAAGSATTSVTGDAALGGAVTGGLLGGTQGALTGAAGALGREAITPATTPTTTPVSDAGTSADPGVQVAGGDDASALKLAQVSAMPEMLGKQGETAGGITSSVDDTGATVYTRTITGKTADGKDYAYTVTYDPAAPQGKQIYYQVQGALGGEDVAIPSAAETVASTQRPTFDALVSEAATTEIPYKPEIVTPPTNIVAAVDNTGTKALVYDQTGTPAIVDIPPGVIVEPNQPVTVDPGTNTITPAPAAPTAPAAPAASAAPEAPAAPAAGAEPTVPFAPEVPVAEPARDQKIIDLITPPVTPAPGAEPGAEIRTGVPGVVGVPENIPSGEPSGVPTGVPSGVPEGVPGGVPEGVPGGVPGGEGAVPVTPEPPAVMPEAPVEPIAKVPEEPVDATEREGTLAKETPVTDQYKPSITTSYGLSAKGGAPSALARVLRTEMAAPVSTTGLTGYRPAGEIESEESGKGRQDVWNEASLRLKDALGL